MSDGTTWTDIAMRRGKLESRSHSLAGVSLLLWLYAQHKMWSEIAGDYDLGGTAARLSKRAMVEFTELKSSMLKERGLV